MEIRVRTLRDQQIAVQLRQPQGSTWNKQIKNELKITEEGLVKCKLVCKRWGTNKLQCNHVNHKVSTQNKKIKNENKINKKWKSKLRKGLVKS